MRCSRPARVAGPGRRRAGPAAWLAVGAIATALTAADLQAAGAPGTVSVMGRTSEPRIGQARGPASAAPGALDAGDAIAGGAHSDWVLHCVGCHTHRARGAGSGRVPDLADGIGWYLRVPGGRAYLVQVPGVNNTGLDDGRIAAVVNYVVEQFAGPSRPADFVPYTAEEVARYRAARPVDITRTRRQLLEARTLAGLPPP